MANLCKNSVLPATNVAKTSSNEIDMSSFMTCAHALAKTYEGHYWVRMSLAMKQLWALEKAKVPLYSYQIIKDENANPIGDLLIKREHSKSTYQNLGDVPLCISYPEFRSAETPVTAYQCFRDLSRLKHRLNRCRTEADNIIQQAMAYPNFMAVHEDCMRKQHLIETETLRRIELANSYIVPERIDKYEYIKKLATLALSNFQIDLLELPLNS